MVGGRALPLRLEAASRAGRLLPQSQRPPAHRRRGRRRLPRQTVPRTAVDQCGYPGVCPPHPHRQTNKTLLETRAPYPARGREGLSVASAADVGGDGKPHSRGPTLPVAAGPRRRRDGGAPRRSHHRHAGAPAAAAAASRHGWRLAHQSQTFVFVGAPPSRILQFPPVLSPRHPGETAGDNEVPAPLHPSRSVARYRV